MASRALALRQTLAEVFRSLSYLSMVEGLHRQITVVMLTVTNISQCYERVRSACKEAVEKYRSSEYAAAIKKAFPQMLQIADR